MAFLRVKDYLVRFHYRVSRSEKNRRIESVPCVFFVFFLTPRGISNFPRSIFNATRSDLSLEWSMDSPNQK